MKTLRGNLPKGAFPMGYVKIGRLQMIKITGKKPIEFIRTIRMKRAQQLLTESQMQVSEIAYTLGYNSPKIFSKHFKEEFNISPSEFIRQQAE